MVTELCPWLGTEEDREIRHAEASEAHVCYAQRRPAAVTMEYQASFCLLAAHRQCRFYSEPAAATVPVAPKADEDEVGLAPRRPSRWVLALWLLSFALVAVVLYLYLPPLIGRLSQQGVAASATAEPAPTHTAALLATLAQPSRLPAVGPLSSEPTATPTPFPGGAIFRLAPEARAAGWVASDEGTGNHLGDSYLYSGVFDGIVYHGVLQFDLSAIASGAAIHAGSLELTGLDRLRVAEGGVWEVRILANLSTADLAGTTYQSIHAAPVQWTLPPPLSSDDLAGGQPNTFARPPEVLRDIEKRLREGHTSLTLRLDGPLTGRNNVFAWDTGYGPATRGNAPRLVLSVGPAPAVAAATPTPRYLVVTSTPTPANVLTAAAMVRTATAQAPGTVNPEGGVVVFWTATPVIVVTSVPTPANQATADYRRALATAVALTTGTFTPTPLNLVTATPSTPEATPQPPTGAASATPQPPPLTVSATPQPPTGTLSPTPGPTATPVPTAPADLQNKILFRSDRLGTANLWAMNPDGLGAAILSDGLAYEAAAAQESLSPDRSRRTYVGQVDGMPAVFVGPAGGGQGKPLVAFQDARLESAVWAPVGDRIAFVALSQSGAQIWLIGASGTGLRELTHESWGAASHPTFSPDGQSLAYASVSVPGRAQIWTIRVDGSDRTNVSDGAHADWDPIWIK